MKKEKVPGKGEDEGGRKGGGRRQRLGEEAEVTMQGKGKGGRKEAEVG